MKTKPKQQYVLDTTIRKQTQTTRTRHAPSYKQLTANTNRTSFSCGNLNGHHNSELRTQRHILFTKQYT